MEVDLNCDMGEGMGNDPLIMPLISSANIACGYHAGDEKTMWETVELATGNNVAVGAHVSFLDRENFGRSIQQLPLDEIYELVSQQLFILNEIAGALSTEIRHVKPHGALYNLAAGDKAVSYTIARAVRDFDHAILLYGLSGSDMIIEAENIGLVGVSEVFADRRYMDDGSLCPRSDMRALIKDPKEAVRQVMEMLFEKTVTSINGKKVPIKAETICIHGDGENAVEIVKEVRKSLKETGVVIAAPHLE